MNNTQAKIIEADNKRDKHELKAIQRKLASARRKAYELEADRDALIRSSDLSPADITDITRLTKGRVSQIRNAG